MQCMLYIELVRNLIRCFLSLSGCHPCQTSMVPICITCYYIPSVHLLLLPVKKTKTNAIATAKIVPHIFAANYHSIKCSF